MQSFSNTKVTFPPMKTKAGTELPLLNLKGKPYLQVAHRLVWFREENDKATIVTEIIEMNDKGAVARATIHTPDGKIWAQGTKKETQTDFPDYIEKAETGAIGRALAMCGYGTQFAPEFDEEERLVDSPIKPAKPATASPADRNKLIGSVVSGINIMVNKKLLTAEEISIHMQEQYKTDKPEAMTNDQIAHFLTWARNLVNKK